MTRRKPKQVISLDDLSTQTAEVQDVPPPPGMDEESKDAWRALYPQFAQAGLVTTYDLHQLQAMCEWWGEYRRASSLRSSLPNLVYLMVDALNKLADKVNVGSVQEELLAVANQVSEILPELVTSDRNRLDTMSKAWRNFNDIAAKFAMTPGDRKKVIGGDSQKKEKTAIEKLLERRKAKLG